MEEVKLLTLFTDGMALYTRNPEGSTQKLLEINKQFQQGYKISIQKSIVLICTCYEQGNFRKAIKDIKPYHHPTHGPHQSIPSRGNHCSSFFNYWLHVFHCFQRKFGSSFRCWIHSISTQLCLTLCGLWTVACQTPLSTEFFRQEFWNGLPFPTPGDLPDLRIEPSANDWLVLPILLLFGYYFLLPWWLRR